MAAVHNQLPADLRQMSVESPEISGALLAKAVQMILSSPNGWGGASPRGLRSDPSKNQWRSGVMSFASMSTVYDRNDLVRAVVDLKRRQICGLEWDIHPVADNMMVPFGMADEVRNLLHNPSLRQTWTEFAMTWAKDLFVYDAAVIEKVRDQKGQVVELRPIDGATVIPQVDEHGTLTGYKQVVHGRDMKRDTVEFAPNDIIYIMANPSTQRLFGHSPIETLALTIGADIYALNHNVSNFTGGNLSDNILALGKVGEQALVDLKAFFEEHEGVGHQLPMISGVEGDAKLLTLRSSNRDMEFMLFATWIFQRICAVFQVSADEVIQLVAHITKAAGETQRAIHSDKGTGPECKIIEDRLTKDLCCEFDPDLKFVFVEEDQTDETEEAGVWEIMFRSGRPMNEIRTARGLEPLSIPTITINGQPACIFDLPLNPTTWLPIGYELTEEGKAAAAQASRATAAAFGAIGLDASGTQGAQVAAVIQPTMEQQPQPVPEAKSGGAVITLRPHTLASATGRKAVKDLVGKLQPIWRDYAKHAADVLERLQKHLPGEREQKMTTGEATAMREFEGEMGTWIRDRLDEEQAIREATDRTLRHAADGVARQLGVSISEDMYSEIAAEYARAHPYEKGVLTSISETSASLLGNRLEAGIESGAPYSEIQADIAECFKELEDWQVLRIAKTEIGTAQRLGGVMSGANIAEKYKLTVEGYTLVPSAAACDSCIMAAEITAAEPVSQDAVEEIETEFLHPNCECGWATKIAEDGVDVSMEAEALEVGA